MAYPAAARRAGGITRRWRRARRRVRAGRWDVFLDPQMVADGRWRWADPTPGLPGVDGVPLTNFGGWLLVGVVMMASCSPLLPRERASEAQPATLLLLDLSRLGGRQRRSCSAAPDVALAGGIAMGLVARPLRVGALAVDGP